MKYVVAAGVCYTHKGKDYRAGDEISKDIFKPEESFEKAVKTGKIIAVSGKAEAVEKPAEEKPVEAEKPAEEKPVEAKKNKGGK